ncbi:MAG: hypothetical protein FWG90_05335 [Oscillospiraceae bacterium]|nr:hypothetical protein [Oscillospiraceae bacterium]
MTKRIISALTAVLLVVSAIGVTSFARGCHGGGRIGQGAAKTAQQPRYEICTVEGCDAYGLHEHDGVYYHCSDYGTSLCRENWAAGRGRCR